MADETYERGLEIRRHMFGAELTDGQIASATDFNRPFQDVVTRYCFGETWGREEELPHRIRSMITLSMLLALGKPHEIRVHIKGAIANGVTREEIREIILHAAVYCGIPSGVEGFRAAAEVFTELGIPT